MEEKTKKERKDFSIKEIVDIKAILDREKVQTQSQVMDVFAKIQKKNPLLVLANASEVSEIIGKELERVKEIQELVKEANEELNNTVMKTIDEVLFDGKILSFPETVEDEKKREKLEKRIKAALHPVAVLLRKYQTGKLLAEDEEDVTAIIPTA